MINTQRIGAILLGVCGLWVSLPTPVFAETINVVAYYPMGEDSDRAVGDPAIETMPATNGVMPLKRAGQPVVSDEVAKRANQQIKSKRSIRFNGGDDAYRGKGPATTAKQNIVIEGWIKPAKGEQSQTFLNLGGPAGFSIAQQKNGLWGVIDGRATVGWKPIQADEWYHVALVIAENESMFYVDGQEVGNAAVTPWGYKKNSPFTIGGHYKNLKNSWAGDIDAVRIFTFEPGTFQPSMLLYHGGRPGEQSAQKKTTPRNTQGTPGISDTPVAPGVDVLQAVMTREPQLHGIEFNRAQAEPVTVNVRGKNEQAWQVSRPNNPNQQWLRAFKFRVTDPAFVDGGKSGGRSVVDLSFTYQLNTWAGIQVYARTTEGWKRVGSGWGDTKGRWRTLRVRLDNAAFASREDDSDENTSGGTSGGGGGWDMALIGANEPLILKQMSVKVYNPTQDVQWSRMLKLNNAQLRNGFRDKVFVFKRDADNMMSIDAINLADIERPISWQLQVSDMDGRPVHQADGQLTLQPDQAQTLAFPFDSSGWRLGPYMADLKLRLNDDDKPVLHRQTRLGIIDDGPWKLAKARTGEFLFGLDPGNTNHVFYGNPRSASYFDLLGVDILRNIPVSNRSQNQDAINEAMVFLKENDLRSMIVMDPPKPNERSKRWQEQSLTKRASLLQWLVENHGGKEPGQIRGIEIGNEPDLPFFWPGEISLYNQRMEVMARAAQEAKVSAGLAKDDVWVMNGGLSFAGPVGFRRSHEFLEMVDPTVLDVLAYHSHGAGIQAERHGFERMEKAVAAAGISGLPFVDTETGVSGTTETGLIEQARTAIEKTVYAQTVGMPALFYFRLYMDNNGGYGMTDRRVEPRPSVMTYRQMVVRLRHHAYVKTIEVPEMGDARINVFLFEERDEQGKPTGRKTLLAFSEQPVQVALNLQIATPQQPADTIEQFDMFGNEAQPAAVPGGLVSLPVSVDPIYLTWTGGLESSTVAIAPSLVQVHLDEPLLIDTTTTLNVTLTNPDNKPLPVVLDASIVTPLDASVSLSTQMLELAANEKQVLPVEITLGNSEAPLALPMWWRVFENVGPEALEKFKWDRIPQVMAGQSGQRVTGQQVVATEGRLDFGRLFGGFKEKQPVVGLAYLDSAEAISLPAAAAADWWMAWYVNGELVYSTLKTGNRHGSLADHTFEMPLKKGRNLIGFVCLSGSGGWSIQFGGPRERYLAQTAGTPMDKLVLTARSPEGQALTHQHLALPMQSPIAPLGFEVEQADRLANWWPLEPVAILDGQAVTNLYMEQPDSSRWYQGQQDLSAVVWLRDAGQTLELMVMVRDQSHEPDGSGKNIGQYDGLRVVLANRVGQVIYDRMFPMNEMLDADVDRVKSPEGKAVTIYRLTLPKPTVQMSETWRLNLRIFDRDQDVMKQTLNLGDVDDPKQGLLMRER